MPTDNPTAMSPTGAVARHLEWLEYALAAARDEEVRRKGRLDKASDKNRERRTTRLAEVTAEVVELAALVKGIKDLQGTKPTPARKPRTTTRATRSTSTRRRASSTPAASSASAAAPTATKPAAAKPTAAKRTASKPKAAPAKAKSTASTTRKVAPKSPKASTARTPRRRAAPAAATSSGSTA
jgi:hypothetical protein